MPSASRLQQISHVTGPLTCQVIFPRIDESLRITVAYPHYIFLLLVIPMGINLSLILDALRSVSPADSRKSKQGP